ncbi:RNA-binding protein 26-like [Dendronephthya gigantea]|uniref:RNA-binding protein 26-like n=1 Tax=Dendronephthya gigantea TaxID=151771 RepID=UPI00106D66B3|nr:RNA-binding protein 26-like [Dendronephthya gigantea]
MQIKNVEAMKTWLTARLEKICDADPAALAKYVVALVRKDKPLGELEEICIDQLEVFLGGETVSFVKTLFEVLQNNSYIPAPPKPTTPLPVEPTKQISPPKPITQPKPIIQPKPITPPKQVSPPKPSNTPGQRSISPVKQNNTPKSINPPPKTSISPQQSNPPSPPRPVNKRLLSTDETLRPQAAESSVLDEDDRDFKRTRKPTEDIEEKPILTVNRDYHSSHKGKKRRIEADHDSGTRIKLSKDDTMEDEKSEAKERMKEEKDDEMEDNEDNLKKKDDEKSGEHDRSEKKREGSSDRENTQRGSESYKGKHGRFDDNRSSVKSRLYKGRPWPKRGRCRDYDEKGYCMRGELCPYDHGNDPLVVEDVNIPGIVLGFPRAPHPGAFIPEAAALNPAGLGMRAPIPSIQYPVRPAAHVTANVHVPTSDHPNAAGPRTSSTNERRSAIVQPTIANVRPHMGMTRYKEVLPNMSEMYNPEQPSFDGRLPEKPPVWSRLGTPPAHIANMPVQRNRELLQVVTSQTQPTIPTPASQEMKNPVAVVPSTNIVATPQVVSTAVQETANVRTLSTPPPPRKYTNTVLEVKKLPPNLNNIATLNGYFQRFGKIVNIQVSAFGQPDVALIQFATNFEAHKAISCADAILGNRFIRIFWYKSETSQQKSQTSLSENNQPASIATTVRPTQNEKSTALAPTMFQTGQTSFKAAVPAAVVSKRDANTRVVEEVVKKKILLQKQKQDLLCKQIENQKLLIKKLEQNKGLNQEDKNKIMMTLKSVSESIAKQQSEVKVSAALVRSKESPSRARQVAQKELLDRELDLITHEQTGEDTTELKYRVEELKKEAQSLGLLDASHRGRGRGRPTRGTARGMSRGHVRVRDPIHNRWDKRPKQLLVEGFTEEEKDTLKQHFKELSGIDRVEQDKDGHRLIITFSTRKQAENAITHVPSFNMKNVKITWYRPSSTSTPPSSSTVGVKMPIKTSQEQGDGENALDQVVEELLLEGEGDEEDDEEERSWRR